MNGFIKELLSLVGVLIGLVLAYRYQDLVEPFITSYTNLEGQTLSLVAFFTIFFAVLLSSYLIAFVLTKLMSFVALGMINRVLGGVFGLAKSLFILVLIVHLISPYTNNWNTESLDFQSSVLYEYLVLIDDKAFEALSPDRFIELEI